MCKIYNKIQESWTRLQSEFDAWNLNFDLQALTTCFPTLILTVSRIFGVQWEPEEFLRRACEVEHPLSPALALPKGIGMQPVESIAKTWCCDRLQERDWNSSDSGTKGPRILQEEEC